MKVQRLLGISAAWVLAGSWLVLGPAAQAQPGTKPGAKPAVGAPASEPVSLRSKWIKGDVAKFDLVMENRRKSGAEGREEGAQTQRLSHQIRLTRRVIDIDGKGGATLSIVYDRVRTDIFAGKSILKFDSADPAAQDAENELAPTVRPTVGRPITVKVDSAGEVISIEGNEEPAPKTDEDIQRANMARSLIGDEIMSRVLRPLYALAGSPERAKVGDMWPSEEVHDRPPIGVLTLDARHTLTAFSDGLASVNTTGTVKLSRAVGNSAVKADLTSYEVKGSAAWDTAIGSMRTFETEQRVVMGFEDQSGAKRSIDTVVKITITRVADAKSDAARP